MYPSWTIPTWLQLLFRFSGPGQRITPETAPSIGPSPGNTSLKVYNAKTYLATLVNSKSLVSRV